MSRHLLKALGAVVLLACEGEPAARTDTTVPADVAGDTAQDTVEVDTVEADTAAPEVEVPVESTYPPPPYGTGYLDIIADLDFYDPWSGETYKLSDYHASETTKVVLIASAAGWCTACMYEAWDLVEVYEKYRDLGLEVLFTLYEDNRSKPFLQEGAPPEEHDRDLTFLQLWRDNLGQQIGLERRAANYPFLVDRGFTLEDYYNEGATPLSIIVRTRDMRILYRQVGYSPGSIDLIVKSVIYQ